MPILFALALAAQQPADVRIIVSTERPSRTRKFERRSPLPPLAPGALPRFSDLPNVAITYYDVAGREVAEIHSSVAKRAPRDPATRRAVPVTSRWTLGVKVHSLTANRRCTVVGASLDFRAAAVMPRLAADPERPAAVAAAWTAYLARLEARQAEQLRFAYERLGEVERAVLGSRCDRAQAAAESVVARLRERQRLAFAETVRDEPRLEQPE